MSLNDFSLKLQGKEVLVCETYTRYCHLNQRRYVNRKDVGHMLPMLSKLKPEAGSPLLSASAAAVCFEFKLQLLSVLAKEVSTLQNPFNRATEELLPDSQLEVINLVIKLILWILKFQIACLPFLKLGYMRVCVCILHLHS